MKKLPKRMRPIRNGTFIAIPWMPGFAAARRGCADRTANWGAAYAAASRMRGTAPFRRGRDASGHDLYLDKRAHHFKVPAIEIGLDATARASPLQKGADHNHDPSLRDHQRPVSLQHGGAKDALSPGANVAAEGRLIQVQIEHVLAVRGFRNPRWRLHQPELRRNFDAAPFGLPPVPLNIHLAIAAEHEPRTGVEHHELIARTLPKEIKTDFRFTVSRRRIDPELRPTVPWLDL